MAGLASEKTGAIGLEANRSGSSGQTNLTIGSGIVGDIVSDIVSIHKPT